MTGDAFVDFRALLKAGHATQRACSADMGLEHGTPAERQRSSAVRALSNGRSRWIVRS